MMQKEYGEQERIEALRLAAEIGASPAGERLGIPCNTIYGWQSKARRREDCVDGVVAERGADELVAENERLKRDLA